MGVIYDRTSTPRLDLGMAMMDYMLSDEKLIGKRILAPFLTPRKEGEFPRILRKSLLQRRSVKRTRGGAYPRGSFEAGDLTYICQERGYEQKLDHSDRAYYASDFDAALVSAEIAMFTVLREQEIDIANLLFDASDTFSSYTDAVDTDWSESSAPIIDDCQGAIEHVRGNTGMRPDTMVIGAATVQDLVTNDDIRNAMSNDSEKAIQAVLNAVSRVLGLERILIGDEIYNSADEGQDATIADIWGNGYALFAVTCREGDSIIRPCLGRTMMWSSDAPEAVMVEQYEEPQTRSTVYRSRNHCDEVVWDAAYGWLLDIRP